MVPRLIALKDRMLDSQGGPLEAILVENSNPIGSLEDRLALTRRQANAAVVLAALGRWEKVAPLLRHTPEPTQRSYLIDRLAGGVEARAVIDRLSPEREPDVSARRALFLALGEFDEDRLPLIERASLGPRFLELYRDDPDPGIHGAVGWLLRKWGQQKEVEKIDAELATGKVEGQRQWYVNGQRQTFMIVPPGEFETESHTEPNKRMKVRVAYRFALAAREVTVAEFRSFRKDHNYDKLSARTEDCPVNNVSWYDAAAYCNWLSEKEEIPEEQRCYVRNTTGDYAEGMKEKANAASLSGYRLPAEAEWELACRAGSVTPWSMGESKELLGKYAWYVSNSGGRSGKVGLLWPNDLGIFDMHGNALEWCSDVGYGFRGSGWVARGGSWAYFGTDCQSSRRVGLAAGGGAGYLGFRLAAVPSGEPAKHK